MSYGWKQNQINFFKKINLNHKFKIKTLNINFKKKKNNNNLILTIYLPFYWNFILINLNFNTLKWLFIYSNFFFINLIIPTFYNFLQYDLQLKTISFFFNFYKNFYKNYWHFFKNVFFSFNGFFFKKFKFKGKGYYIFKNYRNTLILHFGYSHKILFFFFSFFIKFITKTIIFIFGLNKREMLSKAYLFKFFKPLNIFTLKGIRFSKQIIYKKTGKISSYR